MSEAKKNYDPEEQLDITALAEDGADVDLTDDAGSSGAFEDIEALRAERDDMRDRFMRALADAENARKRGERDRREAEQYGGTKLSRDILPVFDNLKRALDAVTDEQREANA
ncbi:MAG: nucleotide exchange factor GrpE, partial [Pseudomonadota bacterium]